MGERFTGRLAAAFVLAFLCLNLAGALCLSWCVTASSAKATVGESHVGEHCSGMKREVSPEERERTKAAAVEPACCMMPVAMLAVPIEKRVEFDAVDMAAVTVEVPFVPAFEPVAASSVIDEIPVYRPPPLDRRIERIQNCVFRI